MGRLVMIFLIAMLLNSLKAAAQLNLSRVKDSTEKKISLAVLPQNFYSRNIGYFCKKEVQLQKLTNIQVYFRLGSKEYVDKMEGKIRNMKYEIRNE
jgi:hypothetical protein